MITVSPFRIIGIAALALAASLVFSPSLLRAADPLEFSVATFKFQRPTDWAWVVPSSPMRKAELAPPGVDDGVSPEVTFFYFGPDQGGTVEQNIQRWVGQFQGGAEESNAMQRVEQYGPTRVTMVTASGTFNSGMPGGPTTPMTGYALLGAILEGTEGNVFIKMTGPAAAVQAATDGFEAMVESSASSPLR